MPIRRIVGATGHLSQAGGVACKVDSTINALDLGLRKPGKTGQLALVSYIYRGWTGWVRVDRLSVSPVAIPRGRSPWDFPSAEQ
jgi:hypothetical protein